MCIGCCNQYGPTAQDVNDDVTRAARLIDRVYEHNNVGGNAHVVLDDWNLEDGHIEWCLQHSLSDDRTWEGPTELLLAEREALRALQPLSLRQRAAALALHDGYL